jgi:CDP-glucose 4,6-dehydratase
LVTAAYRHSFLAPRVAVATVRAGNVIGGGDWATDRVVPDVIRALIAGRAITLRNPGATRPWQHVLDPLEGYLMVAERLLLNAGNSEPHAWNFGPVASETWRVDRLVEMAARCWGSATASWVADGSTQPHEAGTLALDSARARVYLAWQPRLTVAQAVEWTIAWYQAVLGGANARELMAQNMEQYKALG